MINDHEYEDDDDIKDLLVVFHGRSPVLLLLRKLMLSRPLSLDSCHDQYDDHDDHDDDGPFDFDDDDDDVSIEG